MRPPGTLSLIRGKVWGGGEIPTVAKSRGPNSNALAYVKCALSSWVGLHLRNIFFDSGPKFTNFFVKRGVMAVNQFYFQLLTSWFNPEILATKLWCRPKLCAQSILGGSTSACLTFLLVHKSSTIFVVQHGRNGSQSSLFFLFSIPWPVFEIFVVKLKSCNKTRRILDVFALPNFKGTVPPKCCI